MATKPRRFSPNYFYHIYNRGVEKRNIFLNVSDYLRFLETIDYYLYDQKLAYTQYKKLRLEDQKRYWELNPKRPETQRVKLIAYCLMPNHLHFLGRPARKEGITLFLSDITNSYTKYFNTVNERVGHLFQGTYKAKEITNEESLLQVSRYIHLNPLFSSKTNRNGRLKTPGDYPYSSYKEWLDPKQSSFLDREEIKNWLKLFGGGDKYREFVEARTAFLKPQAGIEDLVLEDNSTLRVD